MRIDRIMYERWLLNVDGSGEKIALDVAVESEDQPEDVLQALRVWVEEQSQLSPQQLVSIVREG